MIIIFNKQYTKVTVAGILLTHIKIFFLILMDLMFKIRNCSEFNLIIKIVKKKVNNYYSGINLIIVFVVKYIIVIYL